MDELDRFQIETILGLPLGSISSAICSESLLDAVLLSDREPSEILIKDDEDDAIEPLFDFMGRAIPRPAAVIGPVSDPDYSYCFRRLPKNHDFSGTLALWQKRFGQNPGMTARDFANRIAWIKARIAFDPRLKNLIGVNAQPYFPLILPRIANGADYGKLLKTYLLPAVEASYKAAYPKRSFFDCCPTSLSGSVSIIDRRHLGLYCDLMAEGPIVGILFPMALQGFSQYAQFEMAALMPRDVSLQGPLEASVAEALYIKYLARDAKTPTADLSAVQWYYPGCSLSFCTGHRELWFDSTFRFGRADTRSSGGLFVRELRR